jgi:magnesium-protoporphyrin IX monomethyl ester (oxidative) cyclase
MDNSVRNPPALAGGDSPKILLINPYWIFYPGTNRRLGGPPSTIVTVAAALQPYADVSIFDFMASSRRAEDEDEDFICGKTMEEFAKVLKLSNYMDEFVELLDNGRFDAVGLSSMWTVQHPNTLFLAKFVHDYDKRIRVFAGGHHLTVIPEDSAGIDFVVTGEVENVAEAVVENIKDTKVSLINGSPVADLDGLRFPAYELLDIDFYHRANREHHGSLLLGGMPVVTSRGCPFMCNFCTVWLSMGRKWRANSPEYVKAHLAHLADLGFTKFHFEDDALMLDKNRWMQIMTDMIGCGYQWDTPNAVRLDSLTPELLELAKLSGCAELRVSAETASDYVRNKVVHKNLSLSTLYQTVDRCRDLGIRFCVYFVVGIPGETLEDIRNTLRLAVDLEDNHGVVPRYSVATPFPGTEMLQECIDNGWLTVPYPYTTKQLAGATHGKGLIKTNEFTPDDINEIYAAWKGRRL